MNEQSKEDARIHAEADYYFQLKQLRDRLPEFWNAAKVFKEYGHENSPKEFGLEIADSLTNDLIITQEDADLALKTLIHRIRENRTTVVLPHNWGK